MSTDLPRFAPGVGSLFAVVALVPLLGLGWLAATDVEESAQQVALTTQVADLTAHLDASIRAEALITTESYWAHGLGAVNQLRIPPGFIEQLAGFDVETEYSAARVAVDEATSGGVLPAEAVDLLEQARGASRPDAASVELEAAYNEVETALSDSISEDLRTIRRLTSGVVDANGMTDAVRVLETSVRLREATSHMTEAYFSARFNVSRPGDRSNVDALTRLLLSRLSYRASAETLTSRLDREERLEALWNEVAVEPSVQSFFQRVDAMNDQLLAEGSSAPNLISEVRLGDLPAEGRSFLTSLEAVDHHVEFVAAVSSEVLGRSEMIQQQAEASRNRAVKLTTLMGLAAALAVALASVWIIRPLRRMAAVVGQLREGRAAESLSEGGPAEVRAAARALNEAVANMSVAERMATALADRQLDSPAFQMETTGRLGSSLRDALSALATSIAEREEFRERLLHEATHDGLTGVSNRSSTMGHLGQALGRFRRSDRELAVLFIDIDGFKSVNDTHGHEAGDQVLRTIAKRIQGTIRVGDHLGRIGGDEFVVIAEPADDLASALDLAGRVLGAIIEPVEADGLSLAMSASIGVALATPISTPEELLRDADLALYEAKAEGRSRVNFCSDELKARQQERVTTEKALELAVESDELELHYQPIVEATTGRLSSVEALLRWRQAGGQYMSPAVFIPLAERSDLILAVDRWVLREAARQLEEWGRDDEIGLLPMSVNISARHLSVVSLTEEVLQPLRANDVDPGLLTIEITETALLEDLDQASKTLHDLRAAGVRIAIDDFGTGYASLAHLRRLPVDVLKIDQSFVAGLDHCDERSLVQLTIDTGHLLGASITAEGVETDRQARELTAMGADRLQGFGLGHPMTATDLRSWIRANLDATNMTAVTA